MQLTQYKIGMYKRLQEADRDYANAGERPYFALKNALDYAAWLLLLKDNRRGVGLPPGWSPYELNALTNDDGRLLCLGQLRFGDDCGNTTWAGHIGYSVPPSLRGRGYAKAYLKLCLARAWDLGAERVMLTCDVDNLASKAVIERCGGDFAGVYRDRHYNKLQYWFYKQKQDGDCA